MLVIAGCSSAPEECEVRDLLSEVTSPDSRWSASLYSNVCAAGLVTVASVTAELRPAQDRKSTRLNSSHLVISYAVFCLKKKKKHYAAHDPHSAANHRSLLA